MEFTKEILFECNPNDRLLPFKSLKIIHFNDVYNIESNVKEPKGGAARFLTLIKQLKAASPCLVLFSGDAFSPSARIKFLFLSA